MMQITKPQIKKIKVLQRAVGLDDDGYREMLWGVARVKSCKELQGPKIDLIIRHLEKCAGKITPSPAVHKGIGKAPLRATEAQLQNILRLWGRVSRVAQEWGPGSRQAHEALKTFLHRRFNVAALEWLTLPQAQRAIEALKAMGRRGVA
jgi:hypothetical protein